MSKIHFTKKDLAEIEEKRTPLYEMTFWQRVGQFLKENRYSVIFSSVILIAFTVFAVILFHPSKDCYVLFVTSAFEPDSTFQKDLEKMFEVYTPDINTDGANEAQFDAVYTAYADPKKAAAEEKKLKEMLESSTKYLFLADTANAVWLVENGYAEAPAEGELPGINISDTPFLTSSTELFEFMQTDSVYKNLLTNYRLVLSPMPERSQYEKEDDFQKAARQYAAAFGIYEALRTGLKPSANSLEMLYAK